MSYGDYTYGRCHVFDWGHPYTLKVGKFCSLGANITVYLSGNHRTKWVTTYPFGNHLLNIFPRTGEQACISNGNVIIGNDVWIGTNATILSGVTVGDGSVIAANSHVVKNVEPYSIVGGNPARLIRYRFSHEQISKLLEIQWWNWSVEKINQNMSLLCNENIDEFIKNHTI
jgi:acetyltransferase-like isoleucine patch superfamily enzyme